MGCDIHLHVEIKIGGYWEHYNHPYIHRDYNLFSKMAGVKYYTRPGPISPPRGLPDDITTTTRFDSEQDEYHSHSWLSQTEAQIIQDWFERQGGEKHPPIFGYLFGNSIGSPHKGVENVRIVFWFDN